MPSALPCCCWCSLNVFFIKIKAKPCYSLAVQDIWSSVASDANSLVNHGPIVYSRHGARVN
jgi:hypothetical protein